MFTGIVGSAIIEQIIPNSSGWELKINARSIAAKVNLGDSVAIDGACLSVTDIEGDILSFFVSLESIDKTIIQHYQPKTKINIELPMQPNGYLGGHYVLGHVDSTAVVKEIIEGEKARFIHIEVPEQFVKYVVYKGSIAINGVSLTINQVRENIIELCIIPVTLEKTNLALLEKNNLVNIEFDILAKYTEQLLNKRQENNV